MALAFEGLDRTNLTANTVQVLSQGKRGKADLRVVEWKGRRAILKDFAGKSLPVRLAGWLQIERELRAYRRLEGVAGVPRVYQRLDRYGFIMQEVQGRLLLLYRQHPIDQRRRLLEQVRRILDQAHAAGVIHNDVRGRDNVLLSSDGSVVLVDFAAAICFRPGSLPHRLMFSWLVWVDETAFLKWKRILLPEELTLQEQTRLRRYARLRKLWIFNPKGRGRFDAVVEAGPAGAPEETVGR